jgi:hypothetical protein
MNNDWAVSGFEVWPGLSKDHEGCHRPIPLRRSLSRGPTHVRGEGVVSHESRRHHEACRDLYKPWHPVAFPNTSLFLSAAVFVRR